MNNEKEIDTRLILRVVSDLQKEILRQKDESVIDYLQSQVVGLLLLHKEIEDFRTIKKILAS